MLYRPIVFHTPNRVVPPASWLDHIPFAFWIVDVLRPQVLVELGTHSGNSYAAFAQAIQTLELSTAAYAVDTWQGDSQAGFYGEDVYTEWAAYHERHFASFSRLVRTSFEDAVQHFPDASIDLLHLDGCHIYESVAADFALWRPKLSDRGVVLFHDINIRERDFGAWRLWEELKAQQLATFEFLHGHGLGVLGLGADLPDPLRWLFSRGSDTPHDVRDIRQFFARAGAAISAGFAAAETERRVRAQYEQKHAEEHAATAASLAESSARVAGYVESVRELDAQIAQRDVTLSLIGEDLEALRRELTAAMERLSDRSERLEAAEHELGELKAARGEQGRLIEALLQHRPESSSARYGPRSKTSGLLSTLEPGRRRAERAVRTAMRRLRDTLRTPAALGLIPTRQRRWRRSGVRFLVRRQRFLNARAVVASGLFDEAYYVGCHPDVATSRMSPLVHYLTTGGREGRNPHPLFDSVYYLRRNPDVASAGLNPLVHYLNSGASEGRSPHPLFDTGYYIEANPDVRQAGFEPLGHFLRFGAAEGRQPNPFFDCAYYLRHNRDVAESGMHPLVHFATDGWREGRRPSAQFDAQAYLARHPDIAETDRNPLEHYLEYGRAEGRELGGDVVDAAPPQEIGAPALATVSLAVTPLVPATVEPRTILCLSHVMPYPPRAGNEYRIYRMLCWMHRRGYRIVPIIAPLPGDDVNSGAVRALAEQFSNAVLCYRDGRVEYVLRDVPDVLGSLAGEATRPVAVLLDEQRRRGEQQLALLQMDRTFCHDVAITVVTRLQQAMGPHVLLAEYIWMSRLFPLVKGDVLKVIDTIDVFSTKRDKVVRFGIDDLHVNESEEARRLQDADLIVAIQNDERQQLERLLPGKRVITAGVDYDVVADPGAPSDRRILLVASANPMNRKGLGDFLRFAWPGIQSEVPDAELVVIGKVGESIEVEMPGVIRLGNVEDLAPHYRSARVVINPAVAGTGLKIKTLEALGHLRPVVTWPSGTDGFAPELAAFCEIAHDWYDFARRVSQLLTTVEPRLFSASERDTIVRLMSPDHVYAAMTETFDTWVGERSGADRGHGRS